MKCLNNELFENSSCPIRFLTKMGFYTPDFIISDRPIKQITNLIHKLQHTEKEDSTTNGILINKFEDTQNYKLKRLMFNKIKVLHINSIDSIDMVVNSSGKLNYILYYQDKQFNCSSIQSLHLFLNQINNTSKISIFKKLDIVVVENENENGFKNRCPHCSKKLTVGTDNVFCKNLLCPIKSSKLFQRLFDKDCSPTLLSNTFDLEIYCRILEIDKFTFYNTIRHKINVLIDFYKSNFIGITHIKDHLYIDSEGLIAVKEPFTMVTDIQHVLLELNQFLKE